MNLASEAFVPHHFCQTKICDTQSRGAPLVVNGVRTHSYVQRRRGRDCGVCGVYALELHRPPIKSRAGLDHHSAGGAKPFRPCHCAGSNRYAVPHTYGPDQYDR